MEPNVEQSSKNLENSSNEVSGSTGSLCGIKKEVPDSDLADKLSRMDNYYCAPGPSSGHPSFNLDTLIKEESYYEDISDVPVLKVNLCDIKKEEPDSDLAETSGQWGSQCVPESSCSTAGTSTGTSSQCLSEGGLLDEDTMSPSVKLEPDFYKLKEEEVNGEELMLDDERTGQKALVEDSEERIYLSGITQLNREETNIFAFSGHLISPSTYRREDEIDYTHFMVAEPKINWFQCDKCSYRTQRKPYLKTHLITHKGVNEMVCYPCDHCSFKTKHKRSLNRHLLVHKNINEIGAFQCEHCSFKTKHKGSLMTHLITHKDIKEIIWFQCKYCDYKTKYKGDLKMHSVSHQNKNEITWFQCEHCDYKSKYKGYLKTHSVTHQKDNEVTWFECDKCSFKTKRKVRLNRHIIRHKNVKKIVSV